MIAPGDIAPRRDRDDECYVVVLSNSDHLSMDTGRIIVCPFVIGADPPAGLIGAVPIARPQGFLLPELVQHLPISALDEPIGAAGPLALVTTAAILKTLIT